MADSVAAVASGAQAPDDLTQVGYVAGAYGIAGAIRVTPFSTDADALLNVKTWWLDKPSLRSVTVRTVKMHGGDVVATLVGMAGRDAAEALKGAAVHVSRAEFPALEEDEYYWSDLIGMDVVNLEGEALGKVIDMMSNGPQSILRILPVSEPVADPESSEKAPERLVPFVDQFVKHVDVKSKKITLDWGLDY
ncbi:MULTISPECIES: ribosome maturation factor RimM [unclassified Massilia]|uniref:ribosome maturation factor RimM n=1 Tax=unclassified Massilia TaxID=2609279 RepID=UPI0017807C11|nr:MULTISPECIES: ribosome maturation factor RimM [unclassified Massilia]MBD8531986.1 ribosome maturation factor RimM [Massilia sp. CFBP 13647]MBD8675400.1 ribosome maturation factor RimM [Massilia sp. CFBP 13721]